MKTRIELANFKHPLVRNTAEMLTKNDNTIRGKVEKLFYYVRDDIKFGFSPELDYITASEVAKKNNRSDWSKWLKMGRAI